MGNTMKLILIKYVILLCVVIVSGRCLAEYVARPIDRQPVPVGPAVPMTYELNDRTHVYLNPNYPFLRYRFTSLDASKDMLLYLYGFNGTDIIPTITATDVVIRDATLAVLCDSNGSTTTYKLGRVHFYIGEGRPIRVNLKKLDPMLDSDCGGSGTINIYSSSTGLLGRLRVQAVEINSYAGYTNPIYLQNVATEGYLNYTGAQGQLEGSMNYTGYPAFLLDLARARRTNLGLISSSQVVRRSGPIGKPLDMSFTVRERTWAAASPRAMYNLTIVNNHGCDATVASERLSPGGAVVIRFVYSPALSTASIYDVSWSVPVSITCPTPGPRVFNLNLVTRLW